MPNEADHPAPVGSWKFRRRIIHGTLLYCGVMVPALSFRFPESTLVSQTVISLVGLAGTVIVTYVLGAVYDDKNARRLTPGA